MFDLLKKIYAIAGKQSKRITTMFICDMLKSIFEGFTLGGLGYFLLTLSRAVFQSQPVTRSNIITVFCIMLTGITGKSSSVIFPTAIKISPRIRWGRRTGLSSEIN